MDIPDGVLPVQQNREAFYKLIQANDATSEIVYSAYPDLSVLETIKKSAPAKQLLARLTTADHEFMNINDQRDAFKEGAVAAAPWVGDTGQSAPEYRWDDLGTDKIHVVLSLYTTDLAIRTKKSEMLQLAFSENNAFSVTKIHDGSSFPGDLIHFDYKGGIA